MKSILTSIVVLAFLICNVFAVTFSWDSNDEPDIAGYRLHWGTSTRNYTSVTNCGNVTNFYMTNITFPSNTPIYVAVTAYNSSGLESDFSNEVNFCIVSNQVKELPLTRLRITFSQ